MATPAKLRKLSTVEAGFITETSDNSAPVHYALQVKSFSALVNNNIDEYVSNEFEAAGYKWKMILYPNGDNNTAKDHVSLHVALSDDSILKVAEGIYATVRFSVFDQVNDTYFTMQGKATMFHRLKLQWGISKFMPLEIFNDPSKGYLVNDNCMLGVGIFVLKSCGIGESLSLKKEASLPYLHKWTLTKFSSLHEKTKSEAFTDGNYKWYLELYPKGDTRCNNDYLSLFLYLDNTNLAEGQKVCARFTLRLKGQDGVIHQHKGTCCWFSSKISALGWNKFMSLNEFRKCTPDDCCIIEAEVTVLGEVSTLI